MSHVPLADHLVESAGAPLAVECLSSHKNLLLSLAHSLSPMADLRKPDHEEACAERIISSLTEHHCDGEQKGPPSLKEGLFFLDHYRLQMYHSQAVQALR
jgi:hypothetical protein